MTGQEASEQFRLLVAAVKDYAIFLLDPEGRVMSWNAGAERIKGYRADEILGESFTRFYPPQDVEAGVPARALAQASEHGRFVAYGWRLRKDGSRFYAHVTITALRDADGGLWGFAKVTQDYTEELARQQELADSEERFRTTVEHLLDPLALLSAVRGAEGKVVDFRYEYVNPPTPSRRRSAARTWPAAGCSRCTARRCPAACSTPTGRWWRPASPSCGTRSATRAPSPDGRSSGCSTSGWPSWTTACWSPGAT
jgi:PAS domain S-box-containing protein